MCQSDPLTTPFPEHAIWSRSRMADMFPTQESRVSATGSCQDLHKEGREKGRVVAQGERERDTHRERERESEGERETQRE